MRKEEILANCIDEIRAGKSTLEDCLAKYPDLGDELRPLIQIATGIRPEMVTPSPEFKERARRRLLGAMQPSPARAKRQGIGVFDWLKPLAPARRFALAATVAVLVLLIAGGGTVYASQGSLPDDFLYPVKIATEKARLALTPSDTSKAQLHIAFAERRVQETIEMGKEGKVEEVPSLTTALINHLEQARDLMEAITAAGIDISDVRARLEQSAIQQLGALEATLNEVPEQTKPSIAQALETSGEKYGTAIEAAASTAPAPMLVAGLGIIQIRATDPPPPEVDSVLVEVAEVEVHRVAGPDSEWITIVSEPVTFDLLKIAEAQKFLGSQEVPEGTYTQVRFTITETTVIVGTEEHAASVPSGKLKLVRPFEVKEGEITLVLLDFDGASSLQITGKGQFKLKPVVKLLVPSTIKKAAVEEDEEEMEEEEETEIKGTKVEIEGTVTRFSDTELVLSVAGQEVNVTMDSSVKVKGDLQIGSWVKVEALEKDGSFLATEIEVEDEEKEDGEKDKDKGKGKDKEEDEDEDADEEEVELEGTITSLIVNENGTTSVFIDGQEVIINEATKIKGILEVGAVVGIEGVAQPDGSLLAVEIETEEIDDEAEDEGEDEEVEDVDEEDEDADVDEDEAKED